MLVKGSEDLGLRCFRVVSNCMGFGSVFLSEKGLLGHFRSLLSI